jgi:lipopolysaccharide transport system permease protein
MNELVLEPDRMEGQYWRDLWKYRELFYFLAWCDFLVRYKQTVIGIAWALLRPVLSMLVFTIVFGKIAGLPSEGAVPYSILVYAAMLPWQFFSTSVSECSNSLIVNPSLISKIYFPRLIVPASSVITCFADLLIAFSILLGMMAWYHCWPDWHVVFLPLFIVLAFGASMGVGLWFCSLNVEYRYVVPFVVQFGLFIAPVGFSSSVVPKNWRLVYSLNPMAGVIDGFRWTLLRGNVPLYWPGLMVCIGMTAVICLTGILYFRKMENTFADRI